MRHPLFIVAVQLKLKVDFHYCLIFAYVNRTEAMDERLCVNIMFASYKFYFDAQPVRHFFYYIYAGKNYETVEIHP